MGGHYYDPVKLECRGESDTPKGEDVLRLNVSDRFCLLVFPVDDNECLDESLCEGGQCQNTDGSYICMCQHPMVLDPNTNNCVFIPDVAGKSPPMEN